MRIMHRNEIKFLLAMLSVVLCASDAPASDARVFGELDPRCLDELRGIPLSQRSVRLRGFGLARDKWLPHFLDAAKRYVNACEREEKPDEQTVMRALYGSMLVELLGEREATDALKRIGSVRDPVDSTFTYGALLALDSLGTEREFLLSVLDHPDAETAAMAILTVGVHDAPPVAQSIERVQQARGAVPQISDALQFIKLYHHDVSQYSKLASLDERLQFIQRRLPYNPITGTTDWLDPHTGGDPLARWAAARWAELSREDAPRVAEAIQRVSYYENAEIAASYRQFLTKLADPAVGEHLPDIEKLAVPERP